MNSFKNIKILTQEEFPFLLKQLTHKPKSMDLIGHMPPDTYKYLCVVGSRRCSSYGREVCEKLLRGLAGYPIVIVSGLAVGIDSIAHETALEIGLKAIAFPGSGFAEHLLYSSSKFTLMKKIVDSGGALLSAFPRWQHETSWTFPVRNKLMAGISHITLIIEAKEKSGTLLTADDANEIGRTVLAVPGSIFSHLSRGPHIRIRDGATAVTCSADILEALGLDSRIKKESIKKDGAGNQNLFETSLTADEKMIAEKLSVPMERDELIRSLDFPAGYINSLLAELELKGVIAERQGLVMIN